MARLSTKTDHDHLSQLNAQFIQNFITQDAIAHDKIIHKDFICIESTGEIVERDQYLQSWPHDYDNSGYLTFSYSDEVIRIFGNTGLVRSKTTYTKEVNGAIITGHSVYTDTYVKENGQWLCVQAHITPVKQTSV
jgi:ketosteroid isomerase-like protein